MNILNAFWVGGLICLLCQLLISKTKLTPARILVSLVVLGVALGGMGILKPLKEFAGAGVSVPLLGFGDLMAQGVKDAIEKDGVLGIITGGLTAGAAGITAVIVISVIAGLLFRPKGK